MVQFSSFVIEHLGLDCFSVITQAAHAKNYSQQWRVFVFVHMPLVFRPILSTVVQGSVFFPPCKKDQGLSFLASWGVEGVESAVLSVPFLGGCNVWV